jgi:hypothetical protein
MGRKPKVKGSIINNEIIKYKDEIICQNSQSKFNHFQKILYYYIIELKSLFG